MGQYAHLSIGEREDIMCLRREGVSVSGIARAIGRDKATVSRELSRNSFPLGRGSCYRASTAQARYEARRRRCVRPRLLDDPGLRSLVQGKILGELWSPQQVAGRLALETGARPVSCATIYRAVRERLLDTPELSGTRRGLAGRLRHKGRRRHRAGEPDRRGRIVVSHGIGERPAAAEARERLGDWESDTVAGRQGGPCLVTNVDRKSGYLVGGKAERRASAEVRDVMVESLGGERLETVCPDRGKEFALHAEVTRELGVEFYFALPHHPWQRGTNENTNGLLREWFPKGCDLSAVTDEEVREVYDRLNRRPRKRLGYRTPFEVYHDTVLHLI